MIISFLFLALIGIIVYWNFISWNRTVNDLTQTPPRRYVDLSPWHNSDKYGYNFFQVSLGQFDNIFMKTLYLLIMLQSFLLMRKLEVKNRFLIIGWLLSSLMACVFIFPVYAFREYFVTGLNPYIIYVPVLFMVLQLIIWVYLNMFLFKKLAEKKTER